MGGKETEERETVVHSPVQLCGKARRGNPTLEGGLACSNAPCFVVSLTWGFYTDGLFLVVFRGIFIRATIIDI